MTWFTRMVVEERKIILFRHYSVSTHMRLLFIKYISKSRYFNNLKLLIIFSTTFYRPKKLLENYYMLPWWGRVINKKVSSSYKRFPYSNFQIFTLRLFPLYTYVFVENWKLNDLNFQKVHVVNEQMEVNNLWYD